MGFESQYFRPNRPLIEQEPVVAFYAMPLTRHPERISAMLGRLAYTLDMPIFMSDLFLQDELTIHARPARQNNQPKGQNFILNGEAYSAFFANCLDKLLIKPKTTIGIGDGLGVTAIQAMQLHGTEPTRFDALLLRDGWKFGRHTWPAPLSITRQLGYNAADALRSALHSGPPAQPASGKQLPYLKKMLNTVELTRTPETIHNTHRLIGTAAIHGPAVSIVCLQHGQSGTARRTEQFIQSLHETYAAGQIADGAPAGFRTELAQGWHSDLLDVERTTCDVRNTLGLLA